MLKSIFKTEKSCIYIAEIGLNHNGDYKMAEKMISLAAEAGADAVKFQVLSPDEMNSIFTTSLMEKGTEDKVDKSQIEFFRKFEFSDDQLQNLKAYCEGLGAVFFSSVFDVTSLEKLENIGCSIYKIASSEVTNHPLLIHIAKTGKPVILSTGMATEDEISMAVNLLTDEGAGDIILMHCVSNYPVDMKDMNLNRIISLKERFHLDVGFSDHSDDIYAPAYAASKGARIFEKHFTVGSSYDCPDKGVSLGPEDFRRMIDLVEDAVIMGGTGIISYTKAEESTAKAARRSLFARKDISAGTVIQEKDLIALRPGLGIQPSRLRSIAGKIAKNNIKKDHMIKFEDLE